MKTDLLTTILIGAGGFVAGFVMVSFLDFGIVPSSASFKEVTNEVSSDLVSPSEEIFNKNALNPTVEVYVGGNGEETIEVETETEEDTNGSTD